MRAVASRPMASPATLPRDGSVFFTRHEDRRLRRFRRPTTRYRPRSIRRERAALPVTSFLLEVRLIAESTSRINADQQLLDVLNARGNAFASTSPGSTFLPNGDLTTVATLPLQAGKYFAMAKATVRNSDHNAFGDCRIKRAPDGAFYDIATTNTESIGVSGNISGAVGVMASVITLVAVDTVTMTCETGEAGSDVDYIQLIAVQVGT